MKTPITKAEIRAYKQKHWTRENLELGRLASSASRLIEEIEAVLERQGDAMEAEMTEQLIGMLCSVRNCSSYIDGAIVDVSDDDEALAYIGQN